MGTAREFFAGSTDGYRIYLAVADVVADVVADLGPVEVRVSTSQIAFRRRRSFAYVWRPGTYVASDVPAVLSFALPRELSSPRFKEVAHPTPTVWMHHVELRDAAQVDDEVRRWLASAYEAAG
ncbi:DUF5655 domain-containing protein [Georgenia sp. H159]|uniref:DUF5655 domain-containing protein n=1 Tax=Georgenia sp. H159 TaxID=3076115 RepID=UPI002D77F938|nr:DUF5655 domain-containing protein [Georgenia sp. H159]